MYDAVYKALAIMEQEPTRFRLKFKLPSGLEFEAEGSKDFVLAERDKFLDREIIAESPGPKATATKQPPTADKAAESAVAGAGEALELMPPKSIEKAGDVWLKISSIKNNITVLKVKHPQIAAQEAALIIAGVTRALCDIQPIPALTLSKSLRKSGYITGRLDRLLAHEINAGRVMPVGTKRNRAYHLSDKGLARAYILAEKLAEKIPQPTPIIRPET